MDESIMSVPFLQLGVLVPCLNCGQQAEDVYAESEVAALAGRGVCRRCAAMAGRPVEPLVSPKGEAEVEVDLGAAVAAVEAVAEEVKAEVDSLVEEASEEQPGAPEGEALVQVEETEAEVAEKMASDEPLTAAEEAVPTDETVTEEPEAEPAETGES